MKSGIKTTHMINQNTSKVLKHIVEICRNKNIMKVVFYLKEKNYKYE